jgi:iron(III) transport system ATP-binding protein/putative spermidine/putrescine transport system ATP-binding protein
LNGASVVATQSALKVTKVTKSYDGKRFALKGVSFDVQRGEFVSLLGPSGCGKTTLLRCIAGLESVSDGSIDIGGRQASSAKSSLQPHERKVGMVFQSYALWPHMSVFRNVEYPLQFIEQDAGKRAGKVNRLLSMLGLADFGAAHPFELSGGQQQRVALARALIGDPAIVLFDEPLSNLDAALRDSVKLLIRSLAREMNFTSLYVTHDRSEALAMSDRVVLMNDGNIVQIADPLTMYESPVDKFAGGFLGNANAYSGHIVAKQDGGVLIVRTSDGLEVVGTPAPGGTLEEGAPVDIMMRFGHATPATHFGGTEEGLNRFSVRVRDVIFEGELSRFVCDIMGTSGPDAVVPFTFISTQPVAKVGDHLELAIPYAKTFVFAQDR